MSDRADRTAESEGRRKRSRRSAGEVAKLVGVGVTVVAVVVLAAQNQAPTETRFLVWSAEMPRFALLGIIYLVGVVSGWVVRRRRVR